MKPADAEQSVDEPGPLDVYGRKLEQLPRAERRGYQRAMRRRGAGWTKHTPYRRHPRW